MTPYAPPRSFYRGKLAILEGISGDLLLVGVGHQLQVGDPEVQDEAWV
jgi:hypothetical protein